jgi:putative thiamine transport system substrate-binding protein
MSDPRQLGNPSVLDIAKLPDEARRFFAAIPPIAGMPTQAELGRVLPEPHPSWTTRIAADWERRYTG